MLRYLSKAVLCYVTFFLACQLNAQEHQHCFPERFRLHILPDPQTRTLYLLDTQTGAVWIYNWYAQEEFVPINFRSVSEHSGKAIKTQLPYQ